MAGNSGSSSPCCFSKEKFVNLQRFYKESILTDAIIRLKDEKESIIKEYSVHSLLLVMSSPVFEASFKNFESKVIEMNDASVEVMDSFLNFLYTSEIDLDSVNFTWSMYYLADKYLITQLKQICSDYIVKNTSNENVCTSYEMSKVFNDQLHENFKKILFGELTSVLRSQDFANLSTESLMMLLDRSDLNVNESELFKAVSLWVKNHLAENNEELVGVDEEDSDPEKEKAKTERPKIVVQILDSIFFYDMSPQEFAQVSNLGILTMEESHAILLNLTTENAPLPWPEGFRKCSRKNKNQFNTRDSHAIDLTQGLVQAQPQLSSMCYFTVNEAIAITAIEIASVEEPPDLSLNYNENISLWLLNSATNEMAVSEFSDVASYGSNIRMVFKEPFGLTDEDFLQIGLELSQSGCRRSQILEGALSCDGVTFTFLPLADVPQPLPILSIEFSKLF